jgi:hypothetical protein
MKVKPERPITAVLCLFLMLTGVVLLVCNKQLLCFVPCVVGASLLYLGYKPHRLSVILFGHVCVTAGCFLTTWGIYLLPYCKPKLALVFGRPLFWGLFSIFGGICAIYHGFCRCICDRRSNKPAEQKEKIDK